MIYNFLLLYFLISVPMPDNLAYQLYNKEGSQISYEEMINVLNNADIILFGELHNNPICHWLQLQACKSLFESHDNNLILAAEMFEADDQLIINEYLDGKIKEQHLEAEAKIWSNYKTDYAPLLNFAKEKKIDFIASNIPRRYASLVSREGLDGLESLEKQAKKYISPLPIEVDLKLPGYKNMLSMMGSHSNNKATNFAYAQAVKDATMAHFITENLKKGQCLLHFNGAYHSNNFEGIYWYIQKTKPKLKIVTISSIEQETVEDLDKKFIGIADIVIAIPSDMTKTY